MLGESVRAVNSNKAKVSLPDSNFYETFLKVYNKVRRLEYFSIMSIAETSFIVLGVSLTSPKQYPSEGLVKIHMKIAQKS